MALVNHDAVAWVEPGKLLAHALAPADAPWVAKIPAGPGC